MARRMILCLILVVPHEVISITTNSSTTTNGKHNTTVATNGSNNVTVAINDLQSVTVNTTSMTDNGVNKTSQMVTVSPTHNTNTSTVKIGEETGNGNETIKSTDKTKKTIPGSTNTTSSPVNNSETTSHSTPINNSETTSHSTPINNSETTSHTSSVNKSETTRHMVIATTALPKVTTVNAFTNNGTIIMTSPTLTINITDNGTKFGKAKGKLSVLEHPGYIAGIVLGCILVFLILVCIVLFILYRVRKKDAGSYQLVLQDRLGRNSNIKMGDEFYA